MDWQNYRHMTNKAITLIRNHKKDVY